MRSAQIEIEGIGAARAVEKLAQGGVPVLGAKLQKKGVLIEVDAKHCKKVFAILRGSCYNVKKVSFVGWRKLLARLQRCAGLLVGAAVFAGAVLFCQSRVLRIEVVGSGACYTSEVLALLAEDGTGFFSPAPEGGALTARILALPRVSFCSLRHEGGVLTVQVELSDDALPLSSEPLYAPADGAVYALLMAVCSAVRSEKPLADARDDCPKSYAASLVLRQILLVFCIGVLAFVMSAPSGYDLAFGVQVLFGGYFHGVGGFFSTFYHTVVKHILNIVALIMMIRLIRTVLSGGYKDAAASFSRILIVMAVSAFLAFIFSSIGTGGEFHFNSSMFTAWWGTVKNSIVPVVCVAVAGLLTVVFWREEKKNPV